MESFNEKYKKRSYDFAVRLVKYCMKLRKEGVPYDLFSQLIKSGTSFPANFRAATQARSDAEYYSKLCISVEEGDETIFWLSLLKDAGLAKPDDELIFLQQESQELVNVFSEVKRKKAKKMGKYYRNPSRKPPHT